MVRPPTFGSERHGAEDAPRRRPPYSQPFAHSLPAAQELADRYGSGLIAYTALWIADPGDREDAVAQALTLARNAYERHYPGGLHLQSWLYALVRVGCLAYPYSGGFGTASFPRLTGGLGAHAHGVELTQTALTIVDRREREILELLHRHHLSGIACAAVLGISPAEAVQLAGGGADTVEAFVTAVRLATSGRSQCADADRLAKAWVDDPRREPRTRLKTHVGRCPTCGNPAQMIASVAELLAELPIQAIDPVTLDRLAVPQPPMAAPVGWDAHGFPFQADVEREPQPPQEAPVLAAPVLAAPVIAAPVIADTVTVQPQEVWYAAVEPEPVERSGSAGRRSLAWTRAALPAVTCIVIGALAWRGLTGVSYEQTVAAERPGTGPATDGTTPDAAWELPARPTLTVLADDTTRTADPTTKPTTKPTAKPSAKPTAKPTAKPKSTAKPKADSDSDKSKAKPTTHPTPRHAPTRAPRTRAPRPSTTPPPPAKAAMRADPTNVTLYDFEDSVRITLAASAGTVTWEAVSDRGLITIDPDSGSIKAGRPEPMDILLSPSWESSFDYLNSGTDTLTITWSGVNQGVHSSGTITVTVSTPLCTCD